MFYRFARLFCRIVLFLLRRWKVYGLENVPDKEGLLVISNHVSYWDPVIVGCALNRKVYFMAKSELFAIPVLSLIISSCGAFPVNRKSVDHKVTRQALGLLKQGQAVGIFPEGARSHSEGLLNPHLGVAMLALRGDAPVLPVAVVGSRGFFGKVSVFIGKPLIFVAPQSRKNLKENYKIMCDSMMNEISKLKNSKW